VACNQEFRTFSMSPTVVYCQIIISRIALKDERVCAAEITCDIFSFKLILTCSGDQSLRCTSDKIGNACLCIQHLSRINSSTLDWDLQLGSISGCDYPQDRCNKQGNHLSKLLTMTPGRQKSLLF
jgi:hypothetical protein